MDALRDDGTNMENRLFILAVAIAVIGGLAGEMSPELSSIATLLVTGAGAWIGWQCAAGPNAKDFAFSAAFLVFLNAPDWGNASTQLAGIPYGIGAYAAGIFGALVGLITVIASVGLLRNLMNQTQASTSS
ncbi:MAG: hypothetical protein QF489_06700 [Planctomycetota bacterium]|jgi:hypothetical protein|nr:hypothetical protein [Planctomycetota bacterium]